LTFKVDVALIGTIIGTDPVHFKDSPFLDFVVSPTMDESFTLSGLASFLLLIVFLQKLCSTIYGLWLDGVS
jgi:hypothetical protein